MHAAKQEALDTIGKLPENTDPDETTYLLYILGKNRKGQNAVANGETITSGKLKREFDTQ
jgi:hypothetical protein